MKKKATIIFASLVSSLSFLTCSKPPDYPIEPVISFVSFSQTDLRQGLDTFYIKFAFTDGDGDLGLNLGDTTKNLSLIDTRFTKFNEETFLFPFVPEQGTGNGIRGEATVKVNGTCCRYLGCGLTDTDHPIDSVYYTLQVTDRAGHKSNLLKLPPLRLSCQKAY